MAPEALRRLALHQLARPIAQHLAGDAIGQEPSGVDASVRVAAACPREPHAARATVTVAVCTRNRAAHLPACLDALSALDYPDDRLDIVVVDNAPDDTATRDLVARYPRLRYVCEPRPGLDWARNCAIREARGEIIAYTDDDVSVDRGWVRALAAAFDDEPHAMCVTGLVVPDAIDTPAQALFETYGGFGRGFERRVYRVGPGESAVRDYGGTGRFGTGANMAFRWAFFQRDGLFDPALDVGTPANGGGDLEMFLRVLKAGHALVYEPAAMVRHRHRRDMASLQAQLANNGVGFYAYLVRTAQAYPDERLAVLRLGIWWFFWWNARRLLRALLRPRAFPPNLVLAEMKGSFAGLWRYAAARRHAADVLRRFGAPAQPLTVNAAEGIERSPIGPGAAIRKVDVRKPLEPIADVTGYARTRLFVFDGGEIIGAVDVGNAGAPISASRLRGAIANCLTPVLMKRAVKPPTDAEPSRTLPPDVRVSLVIPTRDRPDDLRRCLTAVQAERASRPLEVVVIDNRPGPSSPTRAVVGEFDGIVFIEERRPGLSYARNAGFVAATGDIMIAIDDDVTVPAGWLERLVAPFARPEVMAVTGHVLPIELETEAQRLFESYGGLGKGFDRFEADGDWFRTRRAAVPTWTLGATANAAFRAVIFSDPAIGVLDEALGAGMPTGCSEDTYLFYRILKAGHTIVYEPTAWVWHRHRRDAAALRRQIYAYSKGHVAYHLTTLLRDGDVRALVRLAYSLPNVYAHRTYARLRGWSDYPLALIVVEIAGTLAGPWALWRARRKVRKLGPGARPKAHHAVSLEGSLTQTPAA